MAKLRVEKKVVETVEVELPFYYAHYLDCSTIYGRVDENGCIRVQHIERGPETCWEVSKDNSSLDNWACYLQPGYHSNKEQFNEALHKAYKFVDTLSKLCYGRGQLR